MDHSQESQRSFSTPSSTPSTVSTTTPDQHTETSSESHTTPPKQESFLNEIIRFAFVALIIVLPIRMFVAQPFIVSGASMETTFSTGEYLIVDQLTYRFEEPRRGDVIIFRYPKDPSKFFIKRVIGIPGDTIDIAGDVVTITNKEHPEGTVLHEESYVFEMSPNTTLTEVLGTGEYFVMGDNRNASSDSRMWGVVQRDKIIGRAFLRLYPFTETEVLPGEVDITNEIINPSE